MKKTIFGAMALMMGLIFTACPPMETPDPWVDYYHTWKFHANATHWYQVTLSDGKLVYLDYQGMGYTLESLTWTPVTNPAGMFKDSHPSGYKVTGTVKAKNGYSLPNVGETYNEWWYISTDKSSLAVGDAAGANSGPFLKQ